MDDTPQRIAILGAGPIGLEAALYGRFLGYDVTVFERGAIADNVRRWGHVRMFSPFRLNASPLGLAALEGQCDSMVLPDPDACLTGEEWRKRYLEPLAGSDLLVDSIRTETTVVAIGRSGCRKCDAPDASARVDREFRILCRPTRGRATAENERYHACDIVIDSTGTFGNSNGMGPDGMPARGEKSAGHLIEHRIPNRDADREMLAGKVLLVVGGGYSAASTLVELEAIAASAPETRVTWLVRHPSSERAPLPRITNDRLPERDRLAEKINRWAAEPPAWLDYRPECWVEALVEAPAGGVDVEWRGRSTETHHFDRVIANVGYRPDRELYRELQVHECYATEGPIALAARLLAAPSRDCLDQAMHNAESLCTTEPNFYILGSKSYGRSSQFIYQTGLLQVRDAFARIGGRADLDLYATIRRRSDSHHDPT